jgi:putative tryptophan/tyrosine transport system substrate-binding protein
VTAYSRRQVVQGMGAAGLGLLAGCGRLPFQRPEPARVPRIGWLTYTPLQRTNNTDAFREGLRERGYSEGQNIVIEYRSAEEQADRLPQLAADLVRLPVDVIVAPVTAVEVAQTATSMIPIVIVYPEDPVANGIVASLARPGGNVTGVTYFAGQLSQKRLGLLKETLPGLSRVPVLLEANQRAAERMFEDLQIAAQAMQVELWRLGIREPGDLDAAFESAVQQQSNALLLGGGRFFVREGPRLAALAAQHQLPAMYWATSFVHDGGLMAYAASVQVQYRRAAYYVDRILKGTKPADLPVEQPTTFDFVINAKTAQALGLTIPHHVLLQATEVIQ